MEKKKDRKAVACIRRWLDDSVFNKVSTETSEISLWKKLKSLYERKKAIFKVLLVRKLMNLTYEQGSFMSQHIEESAGYS